MYKMLSRVSHEKVLRFVCLFLCLVSLIASIQFWGIPVYKFSLSSHDPARCSLPNVLSLSHIFSTIKTSLFHMAIEVLR